MIYSKKILTYSFIILSAINIAYASGENDITYSNRDLSDHLTQSNKEAFNYNKGFKDGYEEGLRVGYSKALKDAKKTLMKYKKRIQSYEVGKYLSKKGKITPPRLYQTRDSNGEIKIIVKGCEVRGKMSVDDILLLPKVDSSYLNNSTSFSANSKDTTPSNSTFLAGVDKPTRVAKMPSKLKLKTTRVFKDTRFYRNLLSASGILYSIEANGGGLRAVFSSPKEADNFARENGLIYGKDFR